MDLEKKMNERRELPVDELYRRRLTLPVYELKDAARYARVTTQNVRDWQRQAVDGTSSAALAPRSRHAPFVQLGCDPLQTFAAGVAPEDLPDDLSLVRNNFETEAFRVT